VGVSTVNGGTAYAEGKVHASLTDIQKDIIVVQICVAILPGVYTIEAVHERNWRVARALANVEMVGMYCLPICLSWENHKMICLINEANVIP
jgi:hypothetical protein